MTNEERSERIAFILEGMDEQTPDEVLIDLLTDCLHWCDQYDRDFTKLMKIARQHFTAETNR